MTDTYKGWKNYATWRVNFEVFNGQSLRDLGMQKLDLHDLGYALMHHANEIIEMDGAKGLALDYARAFIAEVCWREIAGQYLHYLANEDDTGVLEQAAWSDTSAELK